MLNVLKQIVDEVNFREWFTSRAKMLKLDLDPDNPLHFYNWRAAFKAKAEPDAEGHWPSQFKMLGHPELVVNGMDTRTMTPATVELLDQNAAHRLAIKRGLRKKNKRG